MVKRKVDNRIRVLIENGAVLGHRTMVVLVGPKSREQVVYIHHILSKSSLKQANVLWCYKKELTFSSNRKKRMKQLKAKQKMGQAEKNEEDPFETFVAMTDIKYSYYKDTHKILGNTFKMCVLQDFEALSPNILCRTMETVEGGGVILLLLESLTSLRQLYTISMDVHSRYRTEAHQHVVPRFNERFILSLGSCSSCIVMDDLLRILPISSHLRDLQPVPPKDPLAPMSEQDQTLAELKTSLKDTPPIGILVGLCKTLDQAKVVLQFIMTITEKNLQTTVTLTAGRGRGKSAAMGLSIAAAIAFGYSNIFVTSPSPENLKTLFEFALKGLEAIGYEEHMHYQVLRSADPNLSKSIIRVTVNRDHQQVVQYITPGQNEVLGQAELMIVDEAAAIPLPYVQKLMGPYLVFLSSTVSGYEGTGRSLSLKLFDQLRSGSKSSDPSKNTRQLKEMTLEESIRYKNGDQVEAWLHKLLCLDPTQVDCSPQEKILPEQCKLFYVNRDTLFGYHKVSEKFLEQVTGLLVSSHYKNTPDDLQILSDAPAHHLFVLIPPYDETSETLPPVLCVIQVALEGKISKSSFVSALNQKEGRPAGDLIPWTIGNLFINYDFPQLSGVRVVRIATHPDIQKKGYGTEAMKQLINYYEQSSAHADTICEVTPDVTDLNVIRDEEVGLLEETLLPRQEMTPLLQSLDKRVPESLHYIGVSFGGTHQLVTFWKRNGFTPVYVSQVSNKLTGEHTTIMLRVLGEDKADRLKSWLADFWFDFRVRLVSLLKSTFNKYDTKFGLSILTNPIYKKPPQAPSASELEFYITDDDLHRLNLYHQHQCEGALINDVIPNIAHLYFTSKLPGVKLKPIPAAILCGVGIMNKSTNEVANELGVEHIFVKKEMHSLIVQFITPLTLLKKSVSENIEDNTQNIVADIATHMKQSVKNAILNESEGKQRLPDLIDFDQYKIKSEESNGTTKKKKKLKLEQTEIRKKKLKT